MKKKDDFGKRMKMYEKDYSPHILMPLLPICIRLDGKCFHNFTKGMEKPFDITFQGVMGIVTQELIKETNALIGYTQSDEISLILYSDDIRKETYFNRKRDKINSVLASTTSTYFNHFSGSSFEVFDCRCWNVPNMIEAVNYLIWRESDATKNSISAAARKYYSHNQLKGKNGKQMQDMLIEKGINWNDYNIHFKRGLYFRKEEILLPEGYKRKKVRKLFMPPILKVINKIDVIFNNDYPMIDHGQTLCSYCRYWEKDNGHDLDMICFDNMIGWEDEKSKGYCCMNNIILNFDNDSCKYFIPNE